MASYVKGNSDAKAAAEYFGTLDGEQGVWKVTWSSATNPVSYLVLVSKSQNAVLSAAKLS